MDINNYKKFIEENKTNINKFKNKTFFITGATGLIGSAIIDFLCQLNDKEDINVEIIALVRNKVKARKIFAKYIDCGYVNLIIDTVESDNVYDNIPKIDYIIHTASQTDAKSFMNNPVGVIDTNTLGTRKMLELARSHKVDRFLYMSTREVYGDTLGLDTVSESDSGVVDPIDVRSCYPESKRLSETMCAAYSHQCGINTLIFRLAHTYGYTEFMEDGRIWEDFISRTLNNKDIIIKGDGTPLLRLTYISDVVEAIFTAIFKEGDSFSVYNISTDEEVSVKGLASAVVEAVGNENTAVKVLKTPQKQLKGYVRHKISPLECAKIKKIGWKAKVSLQDGLRRMVNYK